MIIDWTNTEKGPCINLVENPEALRFHQEQTETMEDSTEIQDWFCIKPYFIYSRKLLQVSVTIQKFKIQVIILMCLEILLSKHNT